jgi:uncharacterized OB-fold protein
MGIESFGRVSFTIETKAAAFVDYLIQGKVMATKCRGCGTITFPPKMDCPSCLASDVEWFEVTGPGTLATFSTVTYGPSGFEEDAPYTLAIADFGAFKMFGRMCKDIPQADLTVGMMVKVVPVKLANDRISYEFLKT